MRRWWFVGCWLWWGCQSDLIEPSPDPGPTLEAPAPEPTVAPDPVPEPVAPWVPPPDPLARCCHAIAQGCGTGRRGPNFGIQLAGLCHQGDHLDAAGRQRMLLRMQPLIRSDNFYRPLLKGPCSLAP